MGCVGRVDRCGKASDIVLDEVHAIRGDVDVESMVSGEMKHRE